MKTASDAVRFPFAPETIAPVTILDAEGRVVQVVSAEDFRRAHPVVKIPSGESRRQRRAA